VVKGELIGESRNPGYRLTVVFHGIRNQRTKFTAVLSDLDDFLTSHPTETVIMSVKDELRSEDFSRLTWLEMAKYPHRWFLENRVPTLGEVRGKVIIMGRFWISESCTIGASFELTVQVQTTTIGMKGLAGGFQAGVRRPMTFALTAVVSVAGCRIGIPSPVFSRYRRSSRS